MLKDNLFQVEERIREACSRCGRSPEDITLIAVSKTKPVSMIGEIYAEGIRNFGENKPQELRDKYDLLPQDIRWHMIGHLQKNKIKYVIGRACMIHSIDSVELAAAVDSQAAKNNLVMPILAEVNIAGEETKFGLHPEEVMSFVNEVSTLKNVRLCGLMTIAPFVDDPEENRIHFRNLRKLSIDIRNKNIDNISMCELSMGMTNDYEVAIEEGATIVRVGTGIFGERDYSAAGAQSI